MMIGVYNHLLSKVFSFHYHSQKVIGSPGYMILCVVAKEIGTGADDSCIVEFVILFENQCC